MDDVDEFDDEETFLNLDDVLQGRAAPHATHKPHSTSHVSSFADHWLSGSTPESAQLPELAP